MAIVCYFYQYILSECIYALSICLAVLRTYRSAMRPNAIIQSIRQAHKFIILIQSAYKEYENKQNTFHTGQTHRHRFYFAFDICERHRQVCEHLISDRYPNRQLVYRKYLCEFELRSAGRTKAVCGRVLLSTKFIAQTIKIPKIIWIYLCIAPVHTIIAKLLFDYSITSQKSSPNKHRKAPEQTVSDSSLVSWRKIVTERESCV